VDRENVAEVEKKLERLRAHLKAHGYTAALLNRQDQFAWLTNGGDNRVVRTQEGGFGSLVVTEDRLFLVGYTMDADRIYDDELAGVPTELVRVRWHEGPREEKAKALCGQGRILSDSPLPGVICDPRALTRLHYPLSQMEIARLRDLGRRTEEILRRTADVLTPDMTETEVAGLLGAEYERAGMVIEVVLVGSGERIAKYRHPLPSAKRIGNVVLLHPAVRYKGLHANVTRMVCLGGSVPPELERAYAALAELEALTLSMCVPETPFRAIFEARRRLYERLGYPGDWELHFPGGPTGYVLEEDISGDLDATVKDAQVFDWFITVTGAKVEELGLTLGGRRELLSATGRWPTRPFTVNDLTLEIPWILAR